MNGYQRRLVVAGISVAALIIADQFLKRLVATKEISISLLGGRLAIKAWENEIGAVVAVAVGVLVTIAYMLSREHNAVLYSGLVLIAAGGLSNIGDQMLYGAVVDIIHVGDVSFNIADILIITGAGIILVDVVGKQKSNTKP